MSGHENKQKTNNLSHDVFLVTRK